MELFGIENEAEFFPSGTLSDVLKDELADITARWSELEKNKHPVDRLQRVSNATLDAYRQIRASSEASRRFSLTQDARFKVLEALGYEWKREAMPTGLDGHPLIPLLGRVSSADGKDALWIIEAPVPSNEDEASDPLDAKFAKDQFAEEDRDAALLDQTIGECLAKGVFELPDAPRNVLIVGLSQLVLVDSRKWPARSVLRFNLQEVFARSERETLVLMACLIAREARVPEQGVPISDRLEEEAQRNANAVTSSLKKTVRDAIELLGQEVLTVTEGKFPSNYPIKSKRGVWIEGPDLSRECLRYMYRLLFMFYAEANPRLSLLDLKNPIYSSGYSLEGLRDLESVPLRTIADKTGTFLWESLQTTLDLLYTGLDLEEPDKGTGLRLPAVKVSLLDPQSTPLLNSLNLRNEAVQKVIRLLSLRSTNKSTGRISYAKLGIGQLGAVYETLISFTGVVAKNDLIELLPSKGKKSDADPDAPVNRVDDVDPLEPSWFVERRRLLNGEFSSDEVVFKGSEALTYPKGTFIYRLAGRDREKSASYYTPEPLARLLVKHALMERCKGLSADELLELKILEPAMGSAAFLVETTNQLADLYLDRKQQELGKTIPQDQIVVEKQKVRSFIADRNCFGVDLNPIAVELGAISLWLNGLHNSEFSPWFGDQLHAGNSLLGARRASYNPGLTTASRAGDLWLNAKPQEIGWRNTLPEGQIWQWLLPAKDMAKFESDASIRPFAGEAQAKIRTWRQSGFFKKLEKHEVQLFQKLSKVAEALFQQVADDLEKTRISSNDEITIWPDHEMSGNKRMDFHAKAKLTAHLVGDDHATNTLPYKRLKTAMDAWCALWLWPLDQVDKLPSRLEFLNGMAMILEGGFSADGSLEAPSMSEFSAPELDFLDQLEPDAPARDLIKAADKTQDLLFRETNVEALIETFDWLGVATQVAERERFVHFDLIFADVMRARGGFDVIVGNPPWMIPKWDLLAEITSIDPAYITQSFSMQAGDIVASWTGSDTHNRELFLLKSSISTTKGSTHFTSNPVNYPFLGAGSNNLYACFVDLSFRLCSSSGVSALIHQDRHLTKPKGGQFRRSWFRRIRKHLAFRNEIKAKNFAEVGNRKEFSLNVYGSEKSDFQFQHVSSLFLASQAEECFSHDGIGELPPLKNEDGTWNTDGHSRRVIEVDQKTLADISASLNGPEFDCLNSRLPQIYSDSSLNFFLKVAEAKSKSAPLEYEFHSLFPETDAISAGAIAKRDHFPAMPSDVVLTGPMINIGNPFAQCPNWGLRSHRAYETIDVATVRSSTDARNAFMVIDEEKAKRFLPENQSFLESFRLGVRDFIDLNGYRSLVAAILPKKIRHLYTINSIALVSPEDLLKTAAIWMSLPADYFVRAMAPGHFDRTTINTLPNINLPKHALARALSLVAHLKDFDELTAKFSTWFDDLQWSQQDARLPKFSTKSDIKLNEYSRRIALLEIDVLVSQALGLNEEDLLQIYSNNFPVMKNYEGNTWFDATGKIVWTNNLGLPGAGYFEKQSSGKIARPSTDRWKSILASNPMELSCVVSSDYLRDGPHEATRHFVGPFTRCDRIEDYKRAWTHFEALKAQGGS